MTVVFPTQFHTDKIGSKALCQLLSGTSKLVALFGRLSAVFWDPIGLRITYILCDKD